MFNPFEILQQELAEVKQQNAQILQQLQQLASKQEEDRYLSIDETCGLFQPKISRSTLYAYEKQGLLQRHVLGNKICFSRREVLEALRTIKRYQQKGGN